MQENNNIGLIKKHISMKETEVVLTLTVVDKHGEKIICNMIEPLDATLDRVRERIDALMRSFDLVGNIVLQFVTEDDNITKINK